VIIEGVARMSDWLIVAIAGLAMRGATGAGLEPTTTNLLAVPLVASLVILATQALQGFSLTTLRSPRRAGLRLALVWIVVFGLATFACHATRLDATEQARWITRWALGSFIAVVAARWVLLVVAVSLARAGRLSRRVALVGGGDAAVNLLEELTARDPDNLEIVGVFDDRKGSRRADVVAGYPRLGDIDDLVAYARHTRLDMAILTLPLGAEHRLLALLRKLWIVPMDIRVAARGTKLTFRPRAYSHVGGIALLDLCDRPIADWDLVLKTALDRVLGLFCLILASPVMLAVAVAIKIETPGPVLFRQTRYGFNNELITISKFRSMYADRLDFDAARLVSRSDPRVTRVGRFIRRASLDELPQLFDVVFRGDLSLVGPRPHAIEAKACDRLYDEIAEDYHARHRVRPGMTGWAQINGWRGGTTRPDEIRKRVECDLYYIEHWSPLFDLYILALTPWSLLTTKNAY
jgi:Undecaprenyl-phosphate glucose phosphotransferase